MYPEKIQSRWTAPAPAKLNLYLDILGRRTDGFHDLETLMVPLCFGDSVELHFKHPKKSGQPGNIDLSIRFSQHMRFAEVDTSSIPTDRNNLIVRALELLQQRSGTDLGAKIFLTKRIPPGSGMGGGSSDAATALQLANRAWNLNWPQRQLAELAAEIGSDVPFFFQNRAAICRGRGEKIESLDHFPATHFVIARPPVSMGTKEVFQAYANAHKNENGSPNKLEGLIACIRQGSDRNIPNLMLNSLQAVAIQMSPWIVKIRNAFQKLDVVAHQMTGSGSAYFAICRNARQSENLAMRLRAQRLGLVMATCSSR